MDQKQLTIVIPAYNEAENLPPLLSRIDAAMRAAAIRYSLIIVDDYSTDTTPEATLALSLHYPLTVLRKKSTELRGKASSLLAGFSYAQTEFIAMIDADLQYPPEAIPEMLRKLQSGADVVVSKRKKRKIGLVRDTASAIYRSVFGSWLFQLPFDVQSGLKVFRKEVIERISVSPKDPWMFDLQFLIQARDAGYAIVSHDIEFSHRASGKAKIHMLSASLGMALSAVVLKFKETAVIPFHAKDTKNKGEGFHYKGNEYVHFSGLTQKQSALTQLTNKQLLIAIGIAAIFILCIFLKWQLTIIVIVALLTVLYFIDLLFTTFLISKSLSKDQEITIHKSQIDAYDDAFWPLYTIFCPLYKEWQVLPQFVRAMSQLDYPQEKLQVMLLLEEDDQESIDNIAAMKLPSFFEVQVVPNSKPKTKPKALNYGLKFATGDFVVIYDAEDIPDPHQLKKTVLAFQSVPPHIVCIQAKLNFYNPHQNLLTRIFTAEYSLWFDLVLPGLQSISAPIPLGGTSNHFRVADLKKLQGWDAFNVTEDCDLGMRLVKQQYRTAIVNSTTMEEANSQLFNWYGQRSRWIKGYIQTYFVHLRDLGKFSRTLKQPDVITFQIIVGGKILSMFINPFMWLVTFSYFAFRAALGPTIESFYPAPVFYMGVVCLVFGNFLYMYSYMIGCVKRGYFELIKFALVTPFYWLAMSISAWRALFEVIFIPHYWSKTKHGFHLDAAKKKRSESHKKPDKPDQSSAVPDYRDVVLSIGS